MSLTVKITALWGLKVPLEGTCRFSHQPGLGAHIRCFLRHADNRQRHVSGRRSLAQLSLRNLLPMVFKSRLCHNMIPLSVKIRKHAVSPCAQAGPCPTLSNHLVFRPSRNHDKPQRRIRLFAYASQVLGGKMPIRHQKASENFRGRKSEKPF